MMLKRKAFSTDFTDLHRLRINGIKSNQELVPATLSNRYSNRELGLSPFRGNL